jgi:small subunit ribosomal protein S14
MQKPESKYKSRGNNVCGQCGNRRGLIKAYGLQMCRKCFRELAKDLGFRKYM